jgi:hypothetical protein
MSVSVSTFTYTAGYLSSNLVRSVTDIVKTSGLDPMDLHPEVLDRGLKAWIQSHDLTELHLEIYDSRTDALVQRFDFDLDYTYGSTSTGAFWLDTGQVKFAIFKAGLLPSGCKCRVVATTKPGRPDVAGWSSATLRSTDGMTRHAVGAAIGAGSAAAGLAYYTKS